MGIETALLAAGMSAGTASAVGTGFSILSGVSSLVGGLQSLGAGSQQAKNAEAQAAIAAREQVRVSAREAQLEQENVDDVRRRQKLAFMASGVSLQGSPLLVMEETRRKGAENVEEIRMGGGASAGARLTEGRIAASQARSAGRAGFMSGLTSSANSFARLAG
jgi:hypothetical protein